MAEDAGTKRYFDRTAPPSREELDLVLDVLRANRLHESRCSQLRNRRERGESRLGVVSEPPPCDCWLAG